MALALVAGQDSVAFTGSSTHCVLNFLSTPTQNNLLVFAVFSRSDGGIGNPANVITDIDVVNATNADTLRIASRVAGAGEPTAFDFTGDASSPFVIEAWEVSGAATASVLDKTASSGINGSETSHASGTTASTSQSNEICFAAFGMRALVTSPSVDNSFTLGIGINDISANTLVTGYRIVSATGAYTTTASWTTSAVTMGAIATYKDAVGGGGGAATSLIWQPVNLYQLVR